MLVIIKDYNIYSVALYGNKTITLVKGSIISNYATLDTNNNYYFSNKDYHSISPLNFHPAMVFNIPKENCAAAIERQDFNQLKILYY